MKFFLPIVSFVALANINMLFQINTVKAVVVSWYTNWQNIPLIGKINKAKIKRLLVQILLGQFMIQAITNSL